MELQLDTATALAKAEVEAEVRFRTSRSDGKEALEGLESLRWQAEDVVSDLYQDLAVGNVSARQQFALACPTPGSEVISIVGLRPGGHAVTTSVAGTPALGETVGGADGGLGFATPVAGVLTAFWKP